MLSQCTTIAVVGKEERNKDFSEYLAEDQNGHAIGPSEIVDNEVEQGEHPAPKNESSKD